jgi:hypothetical protein
MAERELQFGDMLELTDEGERRIGHLWGKSPKRAVFLSSVVYARDRRIWIVMEGHCAADRHHRDWYRLVRIPTRTRRSPTCVSATLKQ